ncbi:MAG TPA: hypothetical protein VGN72_12405 [Tepidisphaeraceae bacterium]|nr:hypothetical protein [Tepidisphaeraceae bacterium]
MCSGPPVALISPDENLVTELAARAAEVLNMGNAGWAISNTGWNRNGLSTAELVCERS